ncbi:Putative O-methyltransferase domain, S-adenosyl-L-methionine-dependent methyltransferase superfamily [Colletotrichum destructivum]|uniref:O-methyltransferase domain, S-adenosyl-L-methionine-dependent methyltransferase superfamily n=1 Tax=Colletotrichum destructivum TaxID=34406 RepID=A0AAX4IXE0_9PEZI|nr:Putative O-methyltransferase domain, S-adenosyl-L-methionine-dependent methyltransferase superfamily [Colletotrichum destructivum]
MALTPLVEELMENARKYDSYFSNGLHFPSSRGADEEYVEARQAVIDGAQRIRLACMTPDQRLNQYITRAYDVAVIRVLNDVDIANHVPDEGITFSALSKAVGIRERVLVKIMRTIICHGIFSEPEPNFVKHTDVSQLFRLSGIHSLCRFAIDTVLPSMERLLEADAKWKGSQDPSHSAFNIAHNSTGPMYKFPNEACFRAIISPADAKGLSSYPLWQEIDNPGARFVDVGGNCGVIETAEKQERQPGGVLVDQEAGQRLSLKPYDMFSGPQPVRNADVYFYRADFHNWSDFKCQEILRNMLPALKPGAHIVICDIVLPNRCDLTYDQHYCRITDLAMYALHSSWERSETEWKSLFSSVDTGFHVKEIYTLWPGSYQKFIHLVWRPNS